MVAIPLEGFAFLFTIIYISYSRECVRVFLEAADESQFWDAMSTDVHNPVDENGTFDTSARDTPIRLLIKRFPDLAKLALDRCLSTNLATKGKLSGESDNLVTADHEDFTITLKYNRLIQYSEIHNNWPQPTGTSFLMTVLLICGFPNKMTLKETSRVMGHCSH